MRSVTRPPGGSDESSAALTHSQSLADEVREERDVEFAAERRQGERAKRQKLSAEKQLATARQEERRAKSKLNRAKSVYDRVASLREWRRASERRRDLLRITAGKGNDKEEQEAEEEGAVDSKLTSKIMEQARQQQDEVKQELRDGATPHTDAATARILHNVGNPANERDIALDSDSAEGSDDELRKGSTSDSDDGDSDGGGPSFAVGEGNWNSTGNEDGTDDEADLEFLGGTDVTEADELAMAMFDRAARVNSAANEGDNEESDTAQPRLMLADIILQKIKEKEEADAKAAAEAADPERTAREKKIAEVYALVGSILSRYRSGKVPKAFKIIPKQSNWEDLMYLTRPDGWSPAAMFMATRIFASNLTAQQVETFYSDVLLPRCLEDITVNKKLNYHLYQALQKAAYKPDAFNKGILFPLCEPGACTLRQATVIGSVLSKVSIPMLHSAAALLFISELPWGPPNCIFITTLLDKKYSLPYRVIDSLVKHFVEMKSETRPLPLLWHKCLLTFAQRYKMEIEKSQKEQLKLLMRVHTHHQVTPETRRELFSSRNRGDLMDPDANAIAQAVANAA